MRTDPSRRRFIRVAASAAALAVATPALARGDEVEVRWTGRALGADAEIRLRGTDRATTQAALADAVNEVERLESIFSLYRPSSALSRLNAAGHLNDPPIELVRLASESLTLAGNTEGAFDPTVQPLWLAYAAAKGRPTADALNAALKLVDHRRVQVSANQVALRPGMALTFNGIAQGFITDRIAERLAARGFTSSLVDLGELRALDGGDWPVALRGPDGSVRTAAHRQLRGRALSTTASAGTRFESGAGHVFDPRSGLPADQGMSVSVLASTSTVADGLSTALAVLPRQKWQQVLRRFDASAITIDHAGTISETA